jgi:hypothetical protein
MKIKEVFKSLFKSVDEPTEPTYVFELTTQEIENIKECLRDFGLEFRVSRSLYKKLCEAVCDSYDKILLKIYE